MGVLFIAGAGTDIGKTYVTAALTRRIREAGGLVKVLKPVVSGVAGLGEPAFSASDTAILLRAAGLPVDEVQVNACSPWRFAAALAPDRAAAAEGRGVRLAEVVDWCRVQIAQAAPDETVLIEGAGGLMSPVTHDATVLDWLIALACPVLLVTGSYLGAVSHALTAIEVIRTRGVPLQAVVVSESAESVGLAETTDALRRFAPGAEVISLERGGTVLAALTVP